MRLIRHGEPGAERPGLLDNAGIARDLAGIVDDVAGDVLLPDGLQRLRAIDPSALPVVPVGTRLGPCVGRVGKVVGIGLNYAEHARESNMTIPPEPVLFMKATSSIIGPGDDVVLPLGSTKADWEVELGVVIGNFAKSVDEEEARGHIAGYCVVNDLSDRAFQLDGTGQWVKGKSADGFCPLGPWLVTADEVPDPQDLHLWLEVNGERKQDGSTRTMVFGVDNVVSYVSRFMSLHPGDVIATGTPPGVALGAEPPAWLQPGDVMRLGIDGLGIQEQRVVAPR